MRRMSLDYSRRSCAKCRNLPELERNSAPGTFFMCPDCRRRYERTGSKGAAAEDIIKHLLTSVCSKAPLTFAPTRRRKPKP
jgi:hypothetical protein